MSRKPMHRRYITKEWIEIAKERWGAKYDDSKVEYKTKDEEVMIGCPESWLVKIYSSIYSALFYIVCFLPYFLVHCDTIKTNSGQQTQ